MNSEQQALVDRWSGFLAKIDERLGAIITEAQAGVDALAAQYQDDTTILSNAITGLDHRVSQLKDKIEEAWDGQVEEKFDDMDVDGFLDVGLDMRSDFEMAFDEKWALWKVGALAGYYRRMEPLVKAALEKPIYCTQCGGDLELPSRKKIVSVNCAHCGAVNQVIPEPVVSLYYGAGAHAMADEKAEPIRHQIERFRAEVDRWRRAREWAAEPIESMEKWEQMELSYWTTFAQTKAQFLGEPLDQELLDSRMTAFRKSSLENDQRWRRAKGLS